MTAAGLDALLLWADDPAAPAAFYAQMEGIRREGTTLRLPDGHVWQLCPGRKECPTRGPHGIVPALAVRDIVEAKGWIRHMGRPIVFEEVVPGLARFTFLDPTGQPVDMVQELDASTWTRGARIPEPEAPPRPPRVTGLFELSLYAVDTTRALHLYRDTLGLEVGLAYFAHIHLILDTIPLVIRPTWHRCRGELPHTPALRLRVPPDLPGKCRAAGLAWTAPLPDACPGSWYWDGETTLCALVAT